jgi:hypothetical protein
MSSPKSAAQNRRCPIDYRLALFDRESKAPIAGAVSAALIHKALKLLAGDETMVARRATTPAE